MADSVLRSVSAMIGPDDEPLSGDQETELTDSYKRGTRHSRSSSSGFMGGWKARRCPVTLAVSSVSLRLSVPRNHLLLLSAGAHLIAARLVAAPR